MFFVSKCLKHDSKVDIGLALSSLETRFQSRNGFRFKVFETRFRNRNHLRFEMFGKTRFQSRNGFRFKVLETRFQSRNGFRFKCLKHVSKVEMVFVLECLKLAVFRHRARGAPNPFENFTAT